MSRGDLPPLTRERQRLVVLISGTVASIALGLTADLGDDRWFEDLCGAGHMGAVEAAQRYDFESETSFEGFAWPRVFGAMIDLLRRERMRLPPKLATAIDKTAAALEWTADYTTEVRDKGADETEEEACGAATSAGVGLLCMGSPVPDPEAEALRRERLAHMESALALLSERDRSMLVLRYVEGLRLEAVADHFGVHRKTARKRIKDALRRLGGRLRPISLVPPPE